MKKLLIFTLFIFAINICSAQYFQHVYYSTPKNENEWLHHGIRDTAISDSVLNPNAKCYVATGVFKDKTGPSVNSPIIDRVRYLTTTEWGHPNIVVRVPQRVLFILPS